MKPHLLFILLVLIASACVPHKEVIYFNNLEKTQQGEIQTPPPAELVLKPGDVIELSISSISKDANAYFYKPGSEVDKKYAGNTYQLSSKGTIDLPLVGEITLMEKTIEAAESHIKEQLVNYLQKPSVNIRMVSFQITILGEVNAPGIYNIPDASVTILEALGYAGDLTIYGKRNNILIIRNSDSGKQYHRLDLTQSQSLDSPFFHLQNNDVIYVEPSKGLTSRDDNAYRIIPIALSSLTFLAVIISMIK